MLHCCRTTRLPEPADPGRALFPTVHKTGAIGAAAMTGHAVNEMIQRRAEPGRVHPRPDRSCWAGIRCGPGSSPRPSGPGADAHAIMRQTGHRSPVMLEVYAREHAPLIGNAVTRLGL